MKSRAACSLDPANTGEEKGGRRIEKKKSQRDRQSVFYM